MSAASISFSEYSEPSAFGALSQSKKPKKWLGALCADAVTRFADQLATNFASDATLDAAATAVLTRGSVAEEAGAARNVLSWDACASVDVAVFPGALATSELVEKLQRRNRFFRLLSLLRAEEAGDSSDGYAVTAATASAARRFVSAMPLQSELPSIAPDGEGALLMVWGSSDDETMVVVDDWALSMVQHVGRPDAVYLDNLPFDGRTLPSSIADAILAV